MILDFNLLLAKIKNHPIKNVKLENERRQKLILLYFSITPKEYKEQRRTFPHFQYLDQEFLPLLKFGGWLLCKKISTFQEPMEEP